MQRIGAIALFYGVMQASGWAQTTPPVEEKKEAVKLVDKDAAAASLPAIDQILGKHLEAVGGKAALEKLTITLEETQVNVPLDDALFVKPSKAPAAAPPAPAAPPAK